MSRGNSFGALLPSDSEDSAPEDSAPEDSMSGSEDSAPEDLVPVIEPAITVMSAPSAKPLRVLKGKHDDSDLCGVFSISANPTSKGKDKEKGKSKNAKEKQPPKRMLVPTGFITPREDAQARALENAKQKETDQKQREAASRLQDSKRKPDPSVSVHEPSEKEQHEIALAEWNAKVQKWREEVLRLQAAESKTIPAVPVHESSEEKQHEIALAAWNANRAKFYISTTRLFDTIHCALFGSKVVPDWALYLHNGFDIYRAMVSIYLFFNRDVLVEFLRDNNAPDSYVEFTMKKISCAIAECKCAGLANIALLTGTFCRLMHPYLFAQRPTIGQLGATGTKGTTGTTSPLPLHDFLQEFRDEFSALSGVYHVLRVMRVLPEEDCDEFHVRRDPVKIRSIFARWHDHKWFGEKETIIFEFAIMAYKNSSHACAVPNFEPGVASHDFWRNMYHMLTRIFDSARARDRLLNYSCEVMKVHFAEMLSLRDRTIRDCIHDHYKMSAEKLEEAVIVLKESILAGIDEYSESRAKMEELRHGSHGSHDCLYPFVRACSRIAAPWFIGLV